MKKAFYILIGLTILASGKMDGQNNQFLELTKVAIEHFKCSITAKNFKFYGLSSAEAINTVQIGEAIPHNAVALEDLRRYDQEKDPNELVKEMGFVAVPLTDQENKRVESFVLFNRRDGKFQTTGMGQDYFTKNFLDFQNTSELGKEARLIRVPGLNLAYAGIDIDGVLNLISITGADPKETNPRPAAEIFAELARQIGEGEDVPR